jgi:peptide/nickel transport system permease protein
MLNFVIKRLFHLIIILAGVTILVFLMLRFIPGDPAEIMIGETATAEDTQKVRTKMGLDRSYPVQYLLYIKNLLRGDLGVSFSSGSPVSQEIYYRLPATVELGLAALFIAALVGIAAGVISSVRRYSFYDYASMFLSLIGVSIPVFWLGLMLIYFFSVKFPFLPMMNRLSPGLDIEFLTGLLLIDTLLKGNFKLFMDALWHLLLPAVTLATVPMALVTRISRSSMLEVLNRDYVRTARAKGLTEFVVILRHALRNALFPVVTVLGLNLGLLLGGAVLTETVFAWPGLGRFVVSSIMARDYPAVQGCILVFSTLMVLINLLVDILYFYLDPRIRVNE